MQILDGHLPRSLLERGSAGPDVSGVARMVSEVRVRGDEAVAEYNATFDGDALAPFALSAEEVARLRAQVEPEVLEALRFAHERMASFAASQRGAVRETTWDDGAGVRCGTRFVPVERVACYVPGGRFPLPSSALMTVTAARVAGVREVAVFSPRMAPEVAAAAHMAGADTFYRIGGPQAVAAAAYGTVQVGKVDMIVGPGNAYVTEAKRQVLGSVGIDMLAGPREVLIIADEHAEPTRLAVDLLAQAEHDPHALALLFTPSRELAERVAGEIVRFRRHLALPEFIGESLEHSAIVLFESLERCAAMSEEVAPEHLELHVQNAESWRERFKHYGCLFLGEPAAEVFGDYCAGTNHVLPTGGAARFSAGLSPLAFLMPRTWQTATPEAAANLAPTVERLARIEGLNAHAEAARQRRGEA